MFTVAEKLFCRTEFTPTIGTSTLLRRLISSSSMSNEAMTTASALRRTGRVSKNSLRCWRLSIWMMDRS